MGWICDPVGSEFNSSKGSSSSGSSTISSLTPSPPASHQYSGGGNPSIMSYHIVFFESERLHNDKYLRF
jgi:hypothetical protein